MHIPVVVVGGDVVVFEVVCTVVGNVETTGSVRKMKGVNIIQYKPK